MTLDRMPPKLLYPDEYVFALVAKPDRTFEVYQSRYFTITHTQVADRLRSMADSIELLDTE